ncbi:hypothetical protein MUK42_36459 [Musa troglodytarum]|uniref:Uncharacterized protein n=1 Tax=Musa troglodytarum TaxID=320322 RepID=A0A9E7FMR2_9LILI|nr:hypothetical protein MUK42_35573 [Musa troglodytarum]URD98915.1 hypothetical protein MUK42_36459 [Musa troglodytarum]
MQERWLPQREDGHVVSRLVPVRVKPEISEEGRDGTITEGKQLPRDRILLGVGGHPHEEPPVEVAAAQRGDVAVL